jgi:hypothetical protein
MRINSIPLAIGLTAVAFSGLALAQALAPDQPPAVSAKAPEHDPAHHANHIAACAVMCDACAAHCARLIADGKKEHMKSMQHCQDCAAICHSTAAVAARHGPLADLIVAACADACKRCGDECATMKDDKMMAQCADVCRNCERMCREMIKRGFSQ